MGKPLITMWSQAVFEKCEKDLEKVQGQVLFGVKPLTEKMNGWFFHTFFTPNETLIRCDAHEEEDCWKVYVRLAKYDDLPSASVRVNRYPEIVAIPENERFADFWEVRAKFPPPRRV